MEQGEQIDALKTTRAALQSLIVVTSEI